MNGNNYIYGDNVNMHGGTNHTGIVKNQSQSTVTGSSPELQAALTELTRVVAQLRPELSTADADIADEALDDLTGSPETVAPSWRRPLLMISGIATAAGALGQPLGDAVTAVRELLGA
ncbi:DUF5955 family protein [Streptomyces sp. NPDC055092]